MNIADSRFPTSNTNLAAALAALHIPVKSDCPILRTVDEAGGNAKFTFFFDSAGVDFCGASHKSEEIAAGWKDREKFEKANPAHPLVYIRAALEARDWNTRAWHGEIQPGTRRGKFATDDEVLAACWKACGARVVGVADRRWEFDAPPSAVFLDAFDKWNEAGGKETPVALMRRSIECRAVLIAIYRECRAHRRIVLGDPASGQWSEILAAPDANERAIADVYANL